MPISDYRLKIKFNRSEEKTPVSSLMNFILIGQIQIKFQS